MLLEDQQVIDKQWYIKLVPPAEFSFSECLTFLGRSSQEILHVLMDDAFYKLIKVHDESILIKVFREEHYLRIEFPATIPNQEFRLLAAQYVWELLDLSQDLQSFYKVARKDPILSPLIKKHFGLRIIGIPDLFEALCWAIMGQQINLSFAYTLKRRFVENFGEKFTYKDESYWLFPTPEKIAQLDISELTCLQFTSRKAEYILGIAKLMAEGTLTKEELCHTDAQQLLLNIRGVGKWTADYVRMKCLLDPSAFPIADVGLHNAIKAQVGLDKKPTIEEIEEMAFNWKGWEGYATFYLWRSLYD
ncbi:DNA-3-methyladenine glycosylase family protein [Peribacillus alkalitolerans]|uniref:DNA-3-methyladenine glycosylase family protein n=1 Tax=Peribacillus alkalitolerans TaxID=1550385 RepID=UPI0013CF95A7|nr:DNA-3-methyladenine glycosylase [Peribacillus alkalitolerans]